MRLVSIRILGLIATMSVTLHADWKITTVTTAGGRRSVETEYFRGQLKRTDRVNPQNGDRWAELLDYGKRRQIVWDLAGRHQYVVTRMHYGVSRPIAAAGPVVTFERATTDTGERRTLFGRSARHLITHATRSDQPAWESITDGWYIDVNALPREKNPNAFSVLTVGGPRAPTFKVNQTGSVLSGLVVWQKETSISPNTERTLEVTELVEAPLSKDVFRPPPGFRRAIPEGRNQDWMDQLRLYWEWLEDWFTSTYA